MDIQKPKLRVEIPEDAEIAYKGKVFDVYKWKQELYDGSFATFEMVKRPHTVVVFPVLNDGKIILTKEQQPGHKKPFISSPGGRVDPGEDILDAAKRELLEETGYIAEEFILLCSEQPISKMDWIVYTFIAKGLSKISELSLDAGEKIELYPVNFNEFLNIVTSARTADRELLSKIYEAKLDSEKMKELEKLFSPRKL